MSDSAPNDPYNKGGMWAFIFTMVFSLCFFVYISFIHEGVDLQEVKETSPGTSMPMAGGGESDSSAAADFDIGSVEKPWVASDGLVAYGKQVYGQNCAVCHGPTGLGDGPAGKAINARNLVEGSWKVGGDRISLYTTLWKGLAGTAMAAFPQIPSKDRWALVHYVRSISENSPNLDDSKVAEFAKTAE